MLLYSIHIYASSWMNSLTTILTVTIRIYFIFYCCCMQFVNLCNFEIAHVQFVNFVHKSDHNHNPNLNLNPYCNPNFGLNPNSSSMCAQQLQTFKKQSIFWPTLYNVK